MGESTEERLLNLLYLPYFWNDDEVQVLSCAFFICSGSHDFTEVSAAFYFLNIFSK